MTFHKWYSILLFLLISIEIVNSQKTVALRGQYHYHVPENISTEKAKQIALERAITNCLANEFGTIVASNNSTIMHTSNGKTDVTNYLFSETEVKGEWLGHINDPEYSINYQEGILIVSVEVYGTAREIINYDVDLSIKTLCNGTDNRYERDIIYEGDRFYVSFVSSHQGYLLMYLIDEEANAMRLLPYYSDTAESYHVEANKQYVFFSMEHAENKDLVDELQMTCSKDNEINLLYTIYSPNKYSKPLEDIHSDLTISQQSLDKWLLTARVHDSSMQLIRKNIIIKKTK